MKRFSLAEVAVLGLSLAALAQSAAQSEGCHVASEVALSDTRQTAAPTLSPFDAPEAGSHAGQGTLPIGINTAGVITGYYFDSSGVSHGFLRATTGVITTFDAPNAGKQAGQGTAGRSINSGRVITGYYEDSSNSRHGFVRAANGTITSFDVPAGFDTTPLSINSAGSITGYYLDASNTYHGFVRAANGAVTTFDVPGGVTSQGNGTYPLAINDTCGTITGSYTSDLYGNTSGFVRYPDNTIGTFSGKSSLAVSMNSRGINSAACATITGDYLDSSTVYHGFVRAPDGTVNSFDVSGAGTRSNQGTHPTTINTAGTIAGDYIDSANAYHGFVRTAKGGVTTFDASGAGTGAGQGTLSDAINSGGVIAGYFLDSSGVYHGFVRTP